MALINKLRTHFTNLAPSEPFAATSFLTLGSRPEISRALSRLAKAGELKRIARGLYVRQGASPSPLQIAKALAGPNGQVQVHGAEAARLLGLSTQMPMQPIFYTSGLSKKVQIGALEIRLQHAPKDMLALAGRPAGLALTALLYLGKEEVTSEVIAQVRKVLPPGEFEVLMAAEEGMPAWLHIALHAQAPVL